MTQKSTPFDGNSSINIDSGPYSSSDVLNERRHTATSGVYSPVFAGLEATVSAIDNINLTAVVTVSAGQAKVDGTTLYSTSDLVFNVDWSSLSLTSDIIAFQVGICVNRSDTGITHIDTGNHTPIVFPTDLTDYSGIEEVPINTARVIMAVVGTGTGMFGSIRDYPVGYDTYKEIGGVYILPVITIRYTADSINNISDPQPFVPKTLVDQAYYGKDVIGFFGDMEFSIFDKVKVTGWFGANSREITSFNVFPQVIIGFHNLDTSNNATGVYNTDDYTINKVMFVNEQGITYNLVTGTVPIYLNSNTGYTRLYFEMILQRYIGYALITVTSTLVEIDFTTREPLNSTIIRSTGIVYFDSDDPSFVGVGHSLGSDMFCDITAEVI